MISSNVLEKQWKAVSADDLVGDGEKIVVRRMRERVLVARAQEELCDRAASVPTGAAQPHAAHAEEGLRDARPER
eukprot:3673782-Prymnesium_polylepis.1